jgi:hypothetical protein
MIASGYEKAGRGWMNSLLPNGTRSVSAHLAVISVPDVAFGQRIRLRRESDPAFAVGWAYGFPSVHALRVRELSSVDS